MTASPWFARFLRALFGIAGVAFMVVAFLQTWDDADHALLPSWPHLVLALVLLVVGLVLAGGTWAKLIDRPFGRRAVVGFVVAQLGKYIPGAVWQAVGQIGQAVQAKVPASRATVAFMVFALVQIASGGLLGSAFGILGSGAHVIVRIAALSGLGLLVALHRPALAAVVGWFSRRRGIAGSDLVPAQRTIREALLLNLAAVALVCAAFGVIVSELSDVEILEAATAFAMAWTAGLLVIPVPAGLGIREAVLIAALGHAAPTASLISASVFLRLGFLVAEGLIMLLAMLPNGPTDEPLAGTMGEEEGELGPVENGGVAQ